MFRAALRLSAAVSAPGRLPFKATPTCGATPDSKNVEVVSLEIVAPAVVSAPPPVSPSSAAPPPSGPPITPGRDAVSRVPAYVVGGAGGVSLLVGTYFGLKAGSDTNSANALCPEKRCANEDGLAKSDAAGRAAKLANVFVGLGLVGVGAGLERELDAWADANGVSPEGP